MLLNNKLKQKDIPCQGKNEFSDSEPQNIYQLSREFLANCTEFVENIVNFEKSPWVSSLLTTQWASTKSPRNLGKSQKEILLFLQRRYFIRNQPCFVKQTYIADQLKLHRSQVNRTLASLEKNGIILRIQWLYKGRRKNCLILPLIDSISPYFQDDNLPDADFQQCHIKCNTLFCKPPKSGCFSKPFLLYTSLLYINKLINNNHVNINTLNKTSLESLRMVQRSDEPLHHETGAKLRVTTHPDGERKKETQKGIRIMPRFILKQKQRASHPYPEIAAKLKLNGYRLENLPSQDQIDYMNFISFNHCIDVQNHFKIDPRKKYDVKSKAHWYVKMNFDLRHCFIKIIETDNELQWSFADSLIGLWNNTVKEFKTFRGVNLNNKESKAYINAVIAISHCLIFKVGGDMDRMRTAILRLPQGRFNKRPPWNWRTAVSIDKFFMMEFSVTSKNGHNFYLDSEIEFQRALGQYKQKNTKNVKAFDYFKKAYIHEFFPNNTDKGDQACYQMEFKIRKFLDDLIDAIRAGANTYGLSLVLDKSSNASLLRLYFHYLCNSPEYQFNAAKFKTILDMNTWMNFVEKYMRIEMGYLDFWKKEVKTANGK